MNSEKQYFHFTIGPVQGFIAQARRTRDFWAGSFLLSWLSAVAMESCIQQNGTILFPQKDENYMQWLTGKKTAQTSLDYPRQGTVPNRFKAEVDTDFQPDIVTENVLKAWITLADQIYEKDIPASLKNGQIKNIWNRQMKNFWQISWAMTADIKDSSILDRRKNWRSWLPDPEPGIKCMMMDGWQELSGISTPHSKGLNTFWQQVRDNGRHGMKSDLYEGESLCGIAFVKRRFVRYFEDLTCTFNQPKPWAIHGWQLKPGIPSVSYLAGVHWLKTIMQQAKTDPKIRKQLTAFDRAAHELTKERGGWDNEIRCIREQIDSSQAKHWAPHDGNVFFNTMLENAKLYPDRDKAKKVIQTLNKLNKTARMSEATPFYAVLMMDGDSLGKQMSDIENQGDISQGLDEFTKEVKDIVEKNNGFLIYAGGDDVLAILPVEDALACAVTLKNHYNTCFAPYNNITTSLSGAIEYAHIKMPLTRVLGDAHDLLDNIAKERTGRNALAVRVWKPGGTALEWAQPWELVQDDETGTIPLLKLVEIFRNADQLDPYFSSKFFYRIRERFDLLNPDKPHEPLKAGEPKKREILNKEQRLSLMAMEYMNSAKADRSRDNKETISQVKKKISPLMDLCTPHYRDEKGKPVPGKRLDADGALLVRFLAQKEVQGEQS